MSLIDKCKALLLDQHPERDETHSATREAMNCAHCPSYPCPGANPRLCATCIDTRKPLSVRKPEPLYEPEIIPDLPPAQDTLDQKFAAYCKEHLDYFDAIQITAWDMIRDGYTYLSMRDIIGVLRRQGININNSFTSRYTDALIEREPEMERYFHRRARAAGKTKRVYVRAH